MTVASRDSFVLYARAEWRRRWASHLMLSVVTALVVAGVVAPLIAARRSEDSFARLRAATHASDVVADKVRGAASGRVDTVRTISGVEAASADAELFVRPAGTNYFPDFDLYARAPIAAGSRLNTPVITKGRAVRADRADEIVLSETLATRLGLRVGDSMTLESMTPKWIDAAFNGCAPGSPDGPRIPVTVVGLARSPADFGRWKGVMHLGPAFVDHYRDRLLVYDHVEARLSSVDEHTVNRIARALPRGVEGGTSWFADNPGTDDALTTTATALRLVAVAVALAGSVVLVLALARATRDALGDRRTLMALGWTSRRLAAAALLVFAPTILLGTAGGLLTGIALAPRTMLGLARRVDPTPRAVAVDALVVAGVAAGVLALASTVVVLTARRSHRPTRHRRRPASRGELRRPLPASLGLRHALRGDVDGGGRASRGALAALILGVACIVAAFAVSASIERLQIDRSLSGQLTARVVDSGESVDQYDRALPILERDPDVSLVVGLHVVPGIRSRGNELPALAYDVRRGRFPMSVVHGRIAVAPDEVAMGPATLAALHDHVGGRVLLRGDRGERSFRIVGSVLFPEGDFSHDAGVALTTRAVSSIAGDPHDHGLVHQVAFDWKRGTDTRRADRRVVAAGLCPLSSSDMLVPAAVHNLGEVEALPRLLGFFLLLIALAALAHALSTNVTRRSKEFSILRALGIRRRSVAGVVVWQVLCIVAIALGAGIPIGLLIGRRVWTVIANGARVVVVTVEPVGWIAAGVAVTAAVACVFSLVAAWRATRVRPRDALRAE